MQKKTQRSLLAGMAWLGLGGAAVTVFLRVWLMPTLRDVETGLFASGWQVVALMLLLLAVLAVMGFSRRHCRMEIGAPAGPRVGIVTLACGATVALCGLWDAFVWFSRDQLPAPQMAAVTTIGLVAVALQTVFCVAAGAALVRLGLLLVAEGKTRRGMTGWSMLAPVLWMWFRLARYEMSYVSTVRLNESFFVFGMFILEMLFLFRLARYTSGVGKVSAGGLQFFAAATALFALSAPLTRLVMYLLGDSEAYLSNELAGVADVAVGVLAAAVAFGLASTPASTDQVGSEAEGSLAEDDPDGEGAEAFDLLMEE